MTEQEILEKVREKIGNQDVSGVTDRTIQDFYGTWKGFETEENKDVVFGNVLKQCESIKGQHNNAMRQLVERQQELQNLKTEKERMAADLEKLKQNPTPTNPADKKEVSEDVKAMQEQLAKMNETMSALTGTISTLQKEKEELSKLETIKNRKERITGLVKDPKNGMPIEALSGTLIDLWDFSTDKEDAVFLKEIQDKYNEKAKNFQSQFAPVAGMGGYGGSSETFIERKRKERAEEAERKAAKLEKIKEKYKY